MIDARLTNGELYALLALIRAFEAGLVNGPNQPEGRWVATAKAKLEADLISRL